jgi:UDP-N-acetylglucosamine 2-epimerase
VKRNENDSFAEVVGAEKHQILDAMKRTLQNRRELPLESPFGKGKAAERIVTIIRRELSF